MVDNNDKCATRVRNTFLWRSIDAAMSLPHPDNFVQVSDITLTTRVRFGKTVDHVVFKTKAQLLRRAPVNVPPGNQYRALFSPNLKLPEQDRLFIALQYPNRWFGIRTRSAKTVAVKLSEVNDEAQDDLHGSKIYSKFFKDVEVFIGIPVDSSPVPVAPHPPESPPATPKSSHPPPTSTISVPPENPPHPPALEGSAASSAPPVTLGNLEPTPAFQENPHQSASSTLNSDVLSICPRFRVLVIGNSGVGKSALIRKVFGVDDVNVSNEKRGQADIEREFVAKENKHFIVHDSLGLEAGEGNNLSKIKQFVSQRRAMKDIKDRLHAVWVCLPVPYAKGRLLEAGMENFLRERKVILDDIPIVVVLTKLDLLNQQLLFDVSKKGSVKNLEDALAQAESAKPKFLEEYCIAPLRKIADGIPHVAVSARDGLESTIPQLVKTTTSEIERYIKAVPHTGIERQSNLERKAPLYLAEMAQRASIEANINLTIELGKQKYWKGLSAITEFPEEKVKECFHFIHEGIIQAWNLNDLEGILRGDDFQSTLLKISNSAVDGAPGPKGTSESGDDMVHTLAELIGVWIKTPLELPKGVANAAELLRKAYELPQLRIRYFVAYITDFVYVMRILFVLSPQGPITSKNVDIAVKVYEASPYRNLIHFEIHDFGTTHTIPPDSDTAVMEKIEQLIKRYNMTDDEVAELRKRILEKRKMTPAP